MNAMLATIFLFVALGMAATRWRVPIFLASLLIGAVLTGVYFVHPRYM